MKRQISGVLLFIVVILLSILSLLLISIKAEAASFYWVGGPGDWHDLTHWSSTSGGVYPSTDKVQAPQNFDDVIFDASSGFVASDKVTITSSQSAVCRDMAWTGTPSGVGFSSTITKVLDCWGSMTLAANMDMLNWLGILNFKSSSIESITLNGVRLRNYVIEFHPVNGTYTVVGPFRQNHYNRNQDFILDLGTTGKVTFEDTVCVGYELLMKSGVANFDGYLHNEYSGFISNVSYNVPNTCRRLILLHVNTTDTLNINGGSAIGYIQAGTGQNADTYSGVTNFNGDQHDWGRFYNRYNKNSGTINYLNIQANISYGYDDHVTSGLTIDHGGSTFRFDPIYPNINQTTFGFGGHTYYNLIFDGFGYIRYGNGTCDTLIFNEGLINAHSANQVTIGKGSGGLLRMESGNYNIASPNLLTLNIDPTTDVVLNGNCATGAGYVNINNIDFNFSAFTTGSLTSAYVQLENSTASGPLTPNYNAGINSYIIKNVAGWLVTVPTARTLHWVGSGVGGTGDWTNSSSWRDIAIDPAGSAIPGWIGGAPVCPPTIYDSVVFLNGSNVHVDFDSPVCKSMTWVGTGTLYDDLSGTSGALSVLDIYGSLTFSSTTTNNFKGVVRFRTWETYPTVTSNGVSFNSMVHFDAITDAGTWHLQDDFSVDFTTVYIHNLPKGASLQLNRGHFHTDGNDVWTRQFWSLGSNIRSLNLYDSDFYVTNQRISGNNNRWHTHNVTDNLAVNAGTSHIHFTANIAQGYNGVTFGGGHDWYDISFETGQKGFMYMGASNLQNSFHKMLFENSGYIRNRQSLSKDSIHILETGTVSAGSNHFQIHQLTNWDIVVDSAMFHENAKFTSPVTYTNLMKLYPGKHYTIDHATNFTQTLNGTDVLDAQASCVDNIIIEGGDFYSTFNQNLVDYCLINNNTASSATFNYSNSTLVGTTTGWTGVSGTPRTVYWIDITLGASGGQWNDPNSWSLVDGGGPGECPPTLIDTVIFTDNSFTGNDSVIVDLNTLSASCADMRWLNTGAVSPVFESVGIETVEIYGSLILATSMDWSVTGFVRFRSDKVGETITSNGIQIGVAETYFEGAGEWNLLDAADFFGKVRLMQGTLVTNDQDIAMNTFLSNTNDTRTLNLGSSTMTLRRGRAGGASPANGNSSYYAASGTFNVIQNGSTIRMDVVTGNPYFNDLTGQAYGDVIGVNPDKPTWIRNDNGGFHNVTYSFGGYAMTYPGFTANKVESLNEGWLYLQGSDHEIDSLIMTGNGDLLQDNKLNKYVEFTPGKTYTFGDNNTQHLANECEFNCIGTGAENIQFYSSTSGVPAYIRKDSGQICVDFIYMEDNYAIGNGIITGNGLGCTSPECDTLLNDSYAPSESTSGRAKFFAGSNANDQRNNAGWDFSPYPPIPTLDLPTLDKDVCSNENLTVTFEFEGVLPAYVTFDSAGVSIDTILTTPGFGAGSEDLTGSGTAADPYVWIYNTTMPPFEDSLVIEAIDVSFDRCFIGDAVISGDVKFTRICWDPLPVELLHFSAVKEENTGLLRWETASETNNAYFDVQRSADGQNFYSIGKVEGAGNSTQNIAYSFVDENPVSGRNYYRLQQVDFNGDSEFSPVETVDFGELNTVSIYPNPARDALNIETNQKNTTVIIRDISGKTVLIVNQDLEQRVINVSHLAAGSYLVEIINEITMQRIFKKLELVD